MSREEESPRKATCVSKSNHNGGFSKHMWLLSGIGDAESTVPTPQQKQ